MNRIHYDNGSWGRAWLSSNELEGREVVAFISFTLPGNWEKIVAKSGTEEAFLLPNQQPRVWIPAPARFFLFTAHLVDSIEIEPHLMKSNGFHKCSEQWRLKLSTTKNFGFQKKINSTLTEIGCMVQRPIIKNAK